MSKEKQRFVNVSVQYKRSQNLSEATAVYEQNLDILYKPHDKINDNYEKMSKKQKANPVESIAKFMVESDKNEYTFLLISDTHIGHDQSQLKSLYRAYNDAIARNADFILHLGDVFDCPKKFITRRKNGLTPPRIPRTH